MSLSDRDSGGSRFTKLSDLAEEEGDKVGVEEMDINEGRGANQAPKSSEVVRKGKKSIEGEVVAMDVVELCALHPSLL